MRFGFDDNAVFDFQFERNHVSRLDYFHPSLAGQATLGLALTKQLLNASLANNLDAQLELEAEKQGAAGRSEDYTEGVNAFLAKRAPTFRGK